MKNRLDQSQECNRLDRERIDNELKQKQSESAEQNRAETFLAFYAQNHSRLSALVHTLVPCWQDAEEIVQDSLVVLWRKFDEFDPKTSFFAWAAKVAQYEVLSYRRKHQARIVVLSDEILQAVAQTAVDQLDDMELHQEVLEGCIKKLGDPDREIVNLRYRDGGNIQSTADALNRSTGHVQRILRKIRSKLLRCIHLKLAEFGA